MALAYQSRYNARVVASGDAYDTATLQYLDEHFARHVTTALEACLRAQPRRPIDFLVEQLQLQQQQQLASADAHGDSSSSDHTTTTTSARHRPHRKPRSQPRDDNDDGDTPSAATAPLTLRIGATLTCTLTPARRVSMAAAAQLPGLPVMHLLAPAAYEVDAALRHLEAIAVPNTRNNNNNDDNDDHTTASPSPTLVLVEPPCAPTQVVFVKGAAYFIDLVEQLQALRRRKQQRQQSAYSAEHTTTSLHDNDTQTASAAASTLWLPSPGETYDDKALALLRAALCRDGDGMTPTTLHDAMHAVVYGNGDDTQVASSSCPARHLVLLPAAPRGYFDVFDCIDRGMRAVTRPHTAGNNNDNNNNNVCAQHDNPAGTTQRDNASASLTCAVQPPSVLFVSYRRDTAALTLTRVLAAFMPHYERCQRQLLADARLRQQLRLRALGADVLRAYWSDVQRRRASRDEQRALQPQRRRGGGGGASSLRRVGATAASTTTTATVTSDARRTHARTPRSTTSPHALADDDNARKPLPCLGTTATAATTTAAATTTPASPTAPATPRVRTATPSAAAVATRLTDRTAVDARRVLLPSSPAATTTNATTTTTTTAAASLSASSTTATTTQSPSPSPHAPRAHAAEAARQRRRQAEDVAFVAVLHALREEAAVRIQATYRRHRARGACLQLQQRRGRHGSIDGTRTTAAAATRWPRLARPLSRDTPPLLRVCVACLRRSHRRDDLPQRLYTHSEHNNNNGNKQSAAPYAFFDNYAVSAPAEFRCVVRYTPRRRVLPPSSALWLASSSSSSSSLATATATTTSNAATTATAAHALGGDGRVAAAGDSVVGGGGCEDDDDDKVASESESWAREVLVLPPTRVTRPPPRVNVLQRFLAYARLAQCDVLHTAMQLQREFGGLSLLQRRTYDALRSVVLCLLHIAHTERRLRRERAHDDDSDDDDDGHDSLYAYVCRHHVELLAALSRPHATSLRCRTAGGAAVNKHVYTHENVLVRLDDDSNDDADDSASSSSLLRAVAPGVYVTTRAPLRVTQATAVLRALAHAKTQPHARNATTTTTATVVTWLDLCPHPCVYVHDTPWLLLPRRNAQVVQGRGAYDTYATRYESDDEDDDDCDDKLHGVAADRRGSRRHVQGAASRHATHDGANDVCATYCDDNDEDDDDDAADACAVYDDVTADEAMLLRCMRAELTRHSNTLTHYIVDDNDASDDGERACDGEGSDDDEAMVSRHAPTRACRRYTCDCPYAAHETARRLRAQHYTLTDDDDDNRDGRSATRLRTSSAAMAQCASRVPTLSLTYVRLRPCESACIASASGYATFVGRCVAQLQRGACVLLSCELCSQLLYVASAVIVTRAYVDASRDGYARGNKSISNDSSSWPSLAPQRPRHERAATTATTTTEVRTLPAPLQFLDEFHALLSRALQQRHDNVDVDGCIADVHALLHELAASTTPLHEQADSSSSSNSSKSSDSAASVRASRATLLDRIAHHVAAAEDATSALACRRHIVALVRLTETYCSLVLLRVFVALPASDKAMTTALSTPPPHTNVTTATTDTEDEATIAHAVNTVWLSSFRSFVHEHGQLLRWVMHVDPWRACAHRCPDTAHARYSNGLRRWDSDAYICFGVT